MKRNTLISKNTEHELQNIKRNSLISKTTLISSEATDEDSSIEQIEISDDDDGTNELSQTLENMEIEDRYTVTGLANPLNACYANATMQCLFVLREFRVSILSNSNSFNDVVSQILIKRANHCTELRNFLGSPYNTNGQQDAQEFIGMLINDYLDAGFRNELKFNVIESFRYCEQCLSTTNRGNQTESSILMINVPDLPNIDFADLFQFRENDNPCANCDNRNVKERPYLMRVHKYLVICLIRYRISIGEFGEMVSRKIQTKILNFDPENLTIDDYNFKLVGVVKHLGVEVNSGHYKSIVRNGREWIECDDSRISPYHKSANEMIEDGYLLILKRH